MYDVTSGYESGVDWTASGGVYPTMGDSIAMYATNPQTASGGISDGGPISGTSNNHPNNTLPMGNPVTGAIIFIGLVVLIMWMVHSFGKADESFKHIKPSIYDVVIITLAAAAGIPLLKTGAASITSIFPAAAPVSTYLSAA